MKISYNLIRELLPQVPPANELADILTSTGLEVESVEAVESVKGGLRGVVVGHVLSKVKHPNADKLNLTTVDLGNGEPLQIVCGAANVDAGQKVLVATIGATIYPVGKEEGLTLARVKIRGEESNGMICAEDELGLGESHDGIMVLPSDVAAGTPAADYFGVEHDYLIEIGLTPNRTDAISHWGVARDVLAWMKANGRLAASARLNALETLHIAPGDCPVNVDVQSADRCLRYAGVVVQNVVVADSPAWLQNRLRTIGVRPINNLVDITNYVMHLTGQPLHAFDTQAVNGLVVVRTARPDEKLVTLDNVDRALDTSDLMICNALSPMCIAGVFGGAESGVGAQTTSVFIESAVFDPVSVRKSARRHGLNTDASYRFERGVDPEQVVPALRLAASLMCQLAGGSVQGGYTDYYPAPVALAGVALSVSWLNAFCGLQLSTDRVKQILDALDIAVEKENGDTLQLLIPAFRTEVRNRQDVAEEILRIHGFNNVPLSGRLSFSMINRPRDIRESHRINVSAMLCGQGFHEAMNNSLTKSGYAALRPQLWPEAEVVKILNPLSRDLDAMRSTLLFGLLENVAWNRNRKQDDIRLFEFGKEYHKTAGGYREESMLALVVAGGRFTESWNNAQSAVGFSEIRAAAEQVLLRSGISTQVRRTDHPLFEEAFVLADGDEAFAVGGNVAADCLKAVDTEGDVFFTMISWEKVLQRAAQHRIRFTEIPRFPAVRRDLSLLIDSGVEFAALNDICQKEAGELLRAVNLFDVYEGKNLPEGKKSYAISLTLRDDSATLTDERVETIMKRVVAEIANKTGGVLRS
jgi:phenylalanyl-tRNA synthetase beta chain